MFSISSRRVGPRWIAAARGPSNNPLDKGVVNTIAQSEIDNHADTTCFGVNFTPIYFTNQVCEVSPFSSEYQAMMDIPVATAATAWDDPTSGKTHILEFNQGLWFGSKLPHSLISPNQCRASWSHGFVS